MPGFPTAPAVQTITDKLATIAPELGNVPGYYVYLKDPISGTIYESATATDAGGNWSIAGVTMGLTYQYSYGKHPNTAYPWQGAYVASNPALGPNIYVVVPPNGTDDTTTIQAALTSARIAGGGEVWLLGGASLTYKASQLIIGSNTQLILGQGVTIQQLASANANLLQNYAVTNARTVMDAVTNGTTTLTSATAAFVAGDVGTTLWVQGAGIDGEILKTTIQSRTNATTVVMTNAATQTQAATQASIGPRDSGITITGGIWDRGSANPSGNHTSQTFRLRRLDNLTISDMTMTDPSGGGGVRYGISVADVTDYTIERITWGSPTVRYSSDGVHVTGPARRGVIRNQRGATLDDMVSVTPADWPQVNDVFGDILDLTIEDIRNYFGSNVVVKVLGGSNGGQILNTKHIRVKKVAGYADNSAESQGGLVWIGDDNGNAATIGGRIDDVQVDGVWGNVSYGVAVEDQLVQINGTNVGTVRLRNLHIESGTGTLHGVFVNGSAVIDVLDIDGVAIVSSSATSDVVQLANLAHINTLFVSHVTGPLGLWVVDQTSATNLISRLYLSDIYISGAAANGLTRNVAGAYLEEVFISNVRSKGGMGFIGQFGDFATGSGVTQLTLSGVYLDIPTNPIYLLSATAKVVVRAAGGVYLNGKQPALNGGQLSSKDVGFPVDTSLLTPNTAGDLAFHNNAANTPYIVGPAQYDGTRWRPLQGFMASGTAVLVAGAVTVADTKITANSVIRVFMRTPGGTPGAHFIGALTAATSFQIKSTSGTDTSTVYYEVEAY